MKAPNEWVAGPWMDGTLKWLKKYQPFILTVTAIALIAFLLPGRSNEISSAGPDTSQLSSGVGGEQAAGLATNEPGSVTPGSAAQQVTSGGAPVTANTEVLGFEEAKKRGVALVDNCDSGTGKIKIPSFGAPPCVQKYTGSNAGSTWQGVTDKKIVMAYYIPQDNPAADAILKAAGADDSHEQVVQQVKDWIHLFEHHFNMWGRKVDLHIVDGSGAATDDAAAKSDAIKVATQIKAFVSINSPNNTYVNEVVARHVMCMCTVELPNDFYQRWAPYVWSTLQSGDQTYALLGEYMLKRLNGKKAQWAGDAATRNLPRVFGLLQYDTKDFAYKKGAEKFIKDMAAKGIKIVLSYFNGYPDLASNQEQARPVIQRMKEAGATSLICGCDPFAPIFFTQEATRQLYHPEWINVGSALTDTSFFGRTYDQDQWQHNFGLGQLTARLPEKLSDSYRLLTWEFGHEPSAPAGYGVIRAPINIFFRGVHMAGGKLTPETFKAGLFNHPVFGRHMVTVPTVSYGSKVWNFPDYTEFDDVTEIWWDRNAKGEDEIGADGTGMYRYVDGGKRYIPGEWPTTNPKVFDPKGTVLVYENYPPGESPPNYGARSK